MASVAGFFKNFNSHMPVRSSREKMCIRDRLYGDRGTGKSSTVKAMLNEFYPQGLRVIEIPKEALMDFPALVDQMCIRDRKKGI